ncbi:putative transcriptional regulator, TetR family [Oleispira antarctica RB-8]|uniref:Putative transcriptional regulator, TetR family n=1 Tax=Oleispira antarctica RB-8 TaxID=698738 RepID=R4YPZ9_OLEAN|nr:putative transcriptional regulator, TetR family [Oleispira antarctica RB-8]
MSKHHELSQLINPEPASDSSSNGCIHEGLKGGLKGLLGKSLAKIGLSKSEQKKVDREQELVDLAVLILNQEGFGGLSLEKLTAKSSYSKGTIYNHFSSKEDCLSALCIRAVSSILELFKRALMFDGCSREKTVAVHYAYQLYARLEPTMFMAVLSSKSPGVREKTSPERTQIMDALEFEINNFSDAMFRNAVADGSLDLPSHLSIETLTFSNWAMSFGTNALAAGAAEATAINRLDPTTLLLQNIGILLDGMNWQPLSKDWDYQKTWQRVEEEIFADDIQLIKSRKNT